MNKTKCTHPLIRAETYRKYENKKGGISYEVEWLDRDIWDNLKPNEKLKWSHRYRKIEPVPCGQCICCKLNYARDKATLIMLEKQYHKTSWFLTLTYDDEHLPFHSTVNTETGEIFTGASLQVHDTQKFIKKLRKKYPESKIKYVMAGEYGKQTMRPHYHFIIFDIPLDPYKFKKIGINEIGDPIWTTPEIEQIWGKGQISIGEVTWRSACYVARYTLKKMDGIVNNNWFMAQGIRPEFIAWSNGFGNQYFQDNQEKLIITDAVPIKNMKTGQNVKPPKKFNLLLKDIDPELYEKIKRKRIKEAYALQETLSTDLNAEEQREQKNQIMKSNFKDIRRF